MGKIKVTQKKIQDAKGLLKLHGFSMIGLSDMEIYTAAQNRAEADRILMPALYAEKSAL